MGQGQEVHARRGLQQLIQGVSLSVECEESHKFINLMGLGWMDAVTELSLVFGLP